MAFGKRDVEGGVGPREEPVRYRLATAVDGGRGGTYKGCETTVVHERFAEAVGSGGAGEVVGVVVAAAPER